MISLSYIQIPTAVKSISAHEGLRKVFYLLTALNSGGSRIFLGGDANFQSGCANLFLLCRKLHEKERIRTLGAL